MNLLTNTNSAGIYFFADYGHGVRKVQCKWLEDKNMIFAILYSKVTKTKKTSFNMYRPNLYWIRLEFPYFLKLFILG